MQQDVVKVLSMTGEQRIAVVIPAYRVRDHILSVIEAIGPECSAIYVVDDACPENTGQVVENLCVDPRVCVLRHDRNLGVGGAVITGYRQALREGALIVVKIDGDGQMDPALLPQFVAPILAGRADYTKGNRFYNVEDVRRMPIRRIVGNAVLSFMAKLSTGYWDIFDTNNGYTAIHAEVAKILPFERISESYFFETDMLFRLNAIRAVVIDVPMDAKYGTEVSNMSLVKVAIEFFVKHIANFFKRVFYNYYLRDMSIASLELPVGIILSGFGVIFGSYHWLRTADTHVAAPAGTVMLSALPVLLGIQFILAFFAHDIALVPKRSLHKMANGLFPLREY